MSFLLPHDTQSSSGQGYWDHPHIWCFHGNHELTEPPPPLKLMLSCAPNKRSCYRSDSRRATTCTQIEGMYSSRRTIQRPYQLVKIVIGLVSKRYLAFRGSLLLLRCSTDNSRWSDSKHQPNTSTTVGHCRLNIA